MELIRLHIGRLREQIALQGELCERLRERGYRAAIAGMTLPNDASAGLHRALGFEPVGTYRNIGYKFGAWHDVAWTQRTVRARRGPAGRATVTSRGSSCLPHGVVVDNVNVSVLP